MAIPIHLQDYLRLNEHEYRIMHMVLPCVIEEIDYEEGLARARMGEWVSRKTKWANVAAGATRTWCPPTVGEQCLYITLQGRVEMGFILSGFYTTTHNSHPHKRPTINSINFPDGTEISYDWESADGVLTIDGAKSVVIKGAKTVAIDSSEEVTIKCPKVVIEGKLEVSEDIMCDGISMQQHVHGYLVPLKEYGDGKTGLAE